MEAVAVEVEERESRALYNRAVPHTVGGVLAAGRYNPLLRRPYYVARGDGCRLWDVDGNEYIDFSSGQGMNMLGHNHPRLKEAVEKALAMGTVGNHETQYHVELAEKLTEILPGAEKVRLANSGTEATMAALRIARAFTGREKILKFDGHFHGMHDYVFFNAHTPERPYEQIVPPFPDSDGIPAVLADLMITVPFNDKDALRAVIAKHGRELAAVIVEPVAYNLGAIPSDPAWLALLRELTREAGIVLIFDEVLSGFRTGVGGMAEYYGIEPDLATWAKAIAGGWPLAAITGRTDVMSVLNPLGHTVASGTYTGHLPAVLAALAAIEVMQEPDFYPSLLARGNAFYEGFNGLFKKHGLPGHLKGIGTRFGLYFGIDAPVTNYRQARTFDKELNQRFLRQTASHGLYFHDFGTKAAPMHYGITAAHSQADLDESLEKIDAIFAAM